jgi:hypothetical protein
VSELEVNRLRDQLVSMMNEAKSMYPSFRVPIDAVIQRTHYLFDKAIEKETTE